MKITNGLIKRLALFLICSQLVLTVQAKDHVNATKPTIELYTKSFSTDTEGPSYKLQIVIKVNEVQGEVDKEGLTISVLGQLANTKHRVVFDGVSYHDNAGTTHFWYANMKVYGHDSDEVLQIPVWLKYGELGGEVSNIDFERKTAIENFTWTVTNPALKLALNRNDSTDFVIETKKHAAKGLKVVGSTLQDKTTLEKLLVEDFIICLEKTKGECHMKDILPNKLVSVNLKVNGSHPAGVYEGNVTIGVDGVGESTFPLTVYSSNAYAVAFGLFLIFAGLLSAFFTNIWGRHLHNRNRARVTVKRLKLRISQLLSDVSELNNIDKKDLAKVTERLNVLFNSMDKLLQKENGIIPGLLPDSGDNSGWVAGFKTFVESKGQQIEAIGGLVEKGLIPLNEIWQTLTESSERKIVELITKTSTLNIKTIAEMEVVLKKIDAAIEKEKLDTPDAQQTLARDEVSIEERIEASIQELIFTNQAITLISWVFWLFVSMVGGYAALIMNDLSFGMKEDYLICLLWGFGIGVGGEQLKALSPASIATSIGVVVPKPK